MCVHKIPPHQVWECSSILMHCKNVNMFQWFLYFYELLFHITRYCICYVLLSHVCLEYR